MIYVQISSGRGPRECGLAVKHLRKRMLSEGPGAKLVRSDHSSSVVGFDGPDALDYVAGWVGTILWVCEDPLKLGGRKRKNWYIGIKHIELPAEPQIEFRDQDLVWEAMRASGKGGQRVNKIDSKIRLTHVPTGISVVSEHQRSQKQNRETALSLLKQKLKEREDNIFAAVEAMNWSQHNQLERGNPVRTFCGPEFIERE